MHPNWVCAEVRGESQSLDLNVKTPVTRPVFPMLPGPSHIYIKHFQNISEPEPGM